MPAQLTEITAIYLRERVRFTGGDTAVVEVELAPAGPGEEANGLFQGLTLTVKGDFPEDVADPETNQRPPDALQPFQSYRFYGRWASYQNKRTGQSEKQFLCQTYLRTQPHGRAGVIRYLQFAPNVGQATAVALWNKFESDAVRILREQPAVAVAGVNLSHFTQARAAEAAAYLDKEKRLEACSIDLIDLLGGRGFPRNTTKAAITLWGNLAATMIRRNPYLLMRFRGCGFLRCDQMYLEQGGPPNALKRQTLAAWHHLASDTEGHTWYLAQYATQGIKTRIAGAEINDIAALKLAKRAKLIAFRRDHVGRLWVADYRKAEAEKRIADCIAEALCESD